MLGRMKVIGSVFYLGIFHNRKIILSRSGESFEIIIFC